MRNKNLKNHSIEITRNANGVFNDAMLNRNNVLIIDLFHNLPAVHKLFNGFYLLNYFYSFY